MSISVLREYTRVLSSLLWFAATLVVAYGIARAVVTGVRGKFQNPKHARDIAAESVVGALGITSIIALLTTTTLRDWNSIGMFAAILALRSFAKFAASHGG